MFCCRDALDIAGMSDIAKDAADQIQEDFMDKMEMFALYYVGKCDHTRLCEGGSRIAVSDLEIFYLTFVQQMVLELDNRKKTCQETPINTLLCC